MFKSLKCIKNSIKKDCNKKYIKKMYYLINDIEDKLKSIKIKQAILNEYIENANLLEILNLDIPYIEEYNFKCSDDEYELNLLCNLNPDVCEITAKINEYKLEKLKLKIKEKINLYNNDLYILTKIQEYYNKDQDASKNIYLKFGRDKNKNLIAIYFDIDKFITSKRSNLYLFHKKSQNTQYYNTSVLYLKYESLNSYGKGRRIRSKDCGYALICDFRVRSKRLGHGTFMLSNLEQILKQVNKQIRCINRNIDYNDREINEVVGINGIVCPGEDISYEDLVKFYNKNGYPTYHNGYLENKEIYREI